MRIRLSPLASLVLLACGGSTGSSSGTDTTDGTDTATTAGTTTGCPDCGAVEWVVDLSATDAVSPRDVVVDAAGNVIVAGYFFATLDVGGETLMSAGQSDAFVARYSPAGELSWAKALGGAQGDGANGLGLDANGNIFVAGDLSGDVDLGGGTLANPDALTGWVVSYESDGTHRFSQLLGHGGTLYTAALDAAADGSFVVSGHYEGAPDFGDGALALADNRDAFVAAFASDGTVQWARAYGTTGGTSLDYGAGVAFAPDGGVYVALGAQGALDLGMGAVNEGDDDDGVLLALDAVGALQWSQVLGSSGNEPIANTAVSNSGAVLVTGEVQSQGADLGDGVPTAAGGMYAASFTADGAHTWSHVFTPGLTRAWGIDGVGASDVVIAAQFNGATDFGGGPLPDSDDNDMVVARYSADGTHVWSRAFGGMENAFGAAVAGAPDDGVVAVGDFGGTIDFDGTVLTAGGRSGFVVKLSP